MTGVDYQPIIAALDRSTDEEGGEALRRDITTLAQEMDVAHGDRTVLPLAYLEVGARRR